MDLPEAIGDVLGVSTDTGGLLLSCVVLMAVGLALAYAKLDLLPMLIILLTFAGLLTAVGWLSQWLLVMAAIVIVTLFGIKLGKGVTA